MGCIIASVDGSEMLPLPMRLIDTTRINRAEFTMQLKSVHEAIENGFETGNHSPQ